MLLSRKPSLSIGAHQKLGSNRMFPLQVIDVRRVRPVVRVSYRSQRTTTSQL